MKIRSKILVFVFLALAFRIGYIIYSPAESQVQPDSYVYLQLGRNLASGSGLHIGKYYSIRPPGYPVFLAGIFKIFGENILAIQIIQILLSILGAWFLYKITKHYFGSRIAWITLLFYAVSYATFCQPGQILSESLYLFTLLAAVYYLVKENFTVSGILLGLSYLIRQEILVFIVFAAFIEFVRSRKIKSVIKFITPVVVFMLIWGVRNCSIHGKFITGSTYTYKHLYASNVYVFQRLGWRGKTRDIDNIPGNISEIEEEKVRKEWFKDMIKQQPLSRLLSAPFLKLGFFLYPFLPQYDITYMWILPFWIFGMLILKKKILDYWQIYGIFTMLAALIVFLHAIPRYRGVFYPFMLIFASFGLYEIWKKGRYYRGGIFLWFLTNVAVYIFSEPLRLFVKGFLP